MAGSIKDTVKDAAKSVLKGGSSKGDKDDQDDSPPPEKDKRDTAEDPWTKQHEELEEQCVKELMEYIAKNEKPENFISSAGLVKRSIKETFKDAYKTVSNKDMYKSLLETVTDPKKKLAKLTSEPGKQDAKEFADEAAFQFIMHLPGADIGKDLGGTIKKMLTAQFGSAYLHSVSIAKGAGNAKPYNYFANLYHVVLAGKASSEEKQLFRKWFTWIAVTGATAGAGTSLGGLANQAIGGPGGVVLEHLVETAEGELLELGGEVLVDQVHKLAGYKEDEQFRQKISKRRKIGAIAWAVYLSAKPRNSDGPTSALENCRLALRAILGMSHREHAVGRYVAHGDKNTPIVSPKDVCEMLTDGKVNTMIKGDLKQNFAKIASFCDLGKVNPKYDLGYKDETLVKSHIHNLQFILVGLDLKELLEKPLVLV